MNELSASLSGGARRDFTYLHPEILNDRCSIEGDTLKLNNKVNHEEYKILIIPGGTFSADGNAGLDQFIEDVSDIKLFFNTLGYSGN